MLPKKGAALFSFAVGTAAIFFVWLLVAAVISAPIVPAPVLVMKKMTEIFPDTIAVHAAASVFRIMAGILLSVAVGFPLGIVMGYYEAADRFLSPLVYLTYPVPKIALLPIVMLFFGVGEASKIAMIFLIVVFQVLVSVRDAVRDVPEETFYPLYSLGAGFWDIFREVLFFATLPKFITALRLALATALSVLFFAETYGTQHGMGYFIMDAWLRINYLEMYAGIVSLGLIGFILFALLDAAEYFFCRWK